MGIRIIKSVNSPSSAATIPLSTPSRPPFEHAGNGFDHQLGSVFPFAGGELLKAALPCRVSNELPCAFRVKVQAASDNAAEGGFGGPSKDSNQLKGECGSGALSRPACDYCNLFPLVSWPDIPTLE